MRGDHPLAKVADAIGSVVGPVRRWLNHWRSIVTIAIGGPPIRNFMARRKRKQKDARELEMFRSMMRRAKVHSLLKDDR